MLKLMGRPKGTEPPKTNIAARIPTALNDRLEAAAAAEKRSVSQLIWFAVEEYLDRRDGKKETPAVVIRTGGLTSSPSPKQVARRG